MEQKTFNKLVRDNIIDKIRNNGELAIYRVLSDEEYKNELLNKLKEECQEAIDAYNNGTKKEIAAELADILTVLNYIAKSRNIDMLEVYNASVLKDKSKGGFSKKYFLERTAKIKKRKK